ncbi:hypothetical protein BBOV_II001470 [Babesia bovis T2Bo]|uniref:hypothetical protein n=1 Tax=Babesia bovis T2Bo TaxID=484906 RepID=UPI001C35713C|nr:hypothetical protein BBOV_II001470 [Babesia bovis T2Bo]EDO06104.2 hypothetical protein BBOV_II001470 [Babesia bovis T2Bo]
MDPDVDNVYNIVYRDNGIYHNEGNGLWHKCTFCIIGFEDEIPSGKELIKCLISALIVRGASVVKLTNDEVGYKTLPKIDYYICNYSLGYNALTQEIPASQLVTPIWLYACHRDSEIYDTSLLPIFTPVGLFCPLMFSNENITIHVVNGISSKRLRDSTDIIWRFARHCGFKIAGLGETNIEQSQNDTTYLVFGIMPQNNEYIPPLSYISNYKHRCISIQWLMDCYLSGEIKDVTKYLINVDLHMNVLDVPWNKIQTPIDATIAHCVKEGRIICLSYAAAIEANEELLRIIKNDGINIYVINPLWILAPWAVDANAGTERIIYNTLSLVDCDHILLYVSTKESENNAFGIFAQLSMCMEYDKFRCAKRPKMVRNIEMHPLSDIYLPSYPGVASAIPIPQELLSGETLAFMGRTRSFSLYDLIDSIEYLGEENALLEEEEILGPDIHVRKSAHEYYRMLKCAELRWKGSE